MAAELQADARTQLERTWADRPGLLGWLMTVDHKRIGRRYLVTALVFFVLAGVLALLMRTQLAYPENRLMGPDQYNQMFSMHGSAMMFLFAVPDHGSRRDLHGAADGRRAEYCVSATERFQLLGLPVRRHDDLHRASCWTSGRKRAGQGTFRCPLRIFRPASARISGRR